MENSENEINDEFLLQCASNFKPLYDKSDKGYKSILQKENCWANVARSLQTTVPVVKMRFKALREKYRRETMIEEKLSRSGAPSSFRPVWPLMSFFKFMYKYGQEENRATTSNFQGDLPENESDIVEDEHNYSQAIEESVEGNEASYETPTANKKRKFGDTSKMKETEKIDVMLKDVSSALRSINESRVPQKTSDKYDHFSKYLALEIKELGEPHSSILVEQIQLKVINFKQSLRNN